MRTSSPSAWGFPLPIPRPGPPRAPKTLHRSCVEGLLSYGIEQVCPMCREELPPGPEQLFEEGCRLFLPLWTRVERGESSWGSLTVAQQRTVDEVMLKWVLAAEQGLANAQSSLGCMHFHGQGTPQNFKESLRWFTKAAVQGYVQAQFFLGAVYANGQGGIEQDLPRALKWLRLAASQGHELAIETVPKVDAILRASLGATSKKQAPASALDACANCGISGDSKGVKLNLCSRCKAVKYCGKACQLKHWKEGGHRKICSSQAEVQ